MVGIIILKGNMTLQEAILKTIELHPGCSEHKLTLDVTGMINPTRFDEDIFFVILRKLIKDKDIVVLEYILPEVLCTLKSIYFPKGTAFVLEKLR
jgi:dihydroxyacid dehydratase/phosphogluconate dehydratase